MSIIAGAFLFVSAWVGAGLVLDQNLPGSKPTWETTVHHEPQFIVE